MTDILDLQFKSEDLNAVVTIRSFFFLLMKKLWLEQDCFDGKRPFGNSSWDADLIKCLIENKIIKGSIDKYGYINNYDRKELNKFVIDIILKPLFGL